jgi:hypothetical protein
VPRVLSSKQRRSGPRSSYIGSETSISLVDSAQAPYRSDLSSWRWKSCVPTGICRWPCPSARGKRISRYHWADR